MSESLLVLDDVSLSYRVRGMGRGRQTLTAVDGVTLVVGAGEAVAVVGESGCGKSSLARALVGLEPTAGGRIVFDGVALGARRRSPEQRRQIQMVFQDPVLSLNPRLTVRQVLAELLRVHHVVPGGEIDQRCEELMQLVGLNERTLDAYPGALSGGQRQRVGLARALALEPEVLVADEPVSSLDVSVQATILTLLADLRDRLGLAMVFIAHDLGVVRHLCDRVAVMYLGQLVEVGPTAEIFERPRHPYTQALLAAAPSLSRPRPPGSSELVGEPPSPLALGDGCRFRARCSVAVEECATVDPPPTLGDDLGPGHEVRCHVRPQPPDHPPTH